MKRDLPERLACVAESFARDDLYHEAWDVLERLPPERCERLSVFALRLTVCVELGLWERGAELAALIGEGSSAGDREAAERFFQARDRALRVATGGMAWRRAGF